MTAGTSLQADVAEHRLDPWTAADEMLAGIDVTQPASGRTSSSTTR